MANEFHYHIDHYSTKTNRYSLQVFGDISSSTEGNVFVSTYSIQLLLLLLAFGSKSRTQDQIKSVIGLKKADVLNFEITEELSKIDFPDILTVSNGIFVNDMFSLNHDYANNALKNMKTKVEKVNFSAGNSELMINEWIRKSTNGKINNFFKPGSIDGDTKLVLISAVHFRNAWKNEFKETKTSSFCLTPTDHIDIQMMHQTGFFYYFKDDQNKFSAVEIPYSDGGFEMLIILPDKVDGVKDLEQMFRKNPKEIVSIRKNMSYYMVDMDIPKFKFESELNLQNTMENLGCTDMFTPSADFSGMINSGNLKVSNMLHKTVVEVNEKGTEAAGVTGVSIVNYSGDYIPENYKTVKFNACHPFLFIIKREKYIIFMGRISNPKE